MSAHLAIGAVAALAALGAACGRRQQAGSRAVSGSTWYHGAPEPFEAFEVRHGLTFGQGASEVPLFFSPSRSFAEGYAVGPDAVVYTVRLRWRKIFDSGDLYVDDGSPYWPPELGSLTAAGRKLYDDLASGRVFPELDEEGLVEGHPSLWQNILRMDYDLIETTELKNWLKSNGYDAALVTGDGPTNVFVFSPDQVEIVSVDPRWSSH